MGAYLAQAVDGLAILIFRAGQGPIEPGLLVGQRTRPVIDPDMVVPVDIEAADLAENPVIGQRLGPRWIDNETRRLAGLDALYTPVFLNSRSREPLFFRTLTLGSAAITRPVRVRIAGSAAVSLRWIIILVFPFNTLPEWTE